MGLSFSLTIFPYVTVSFFISIFGHSPPLTVWSPGKGERFPHSLCFLQHWCMFLPDDCTCRLLSCCRIFSQVSVGLGRHRTLSGRKQWELPLDPPLCGHSQPPRTCPDLQPDRDGAGSHRLNSECALAHPSVSAGCILLLEKLSHGSPVVQTWLSSQLATPGPMWLWLALSATTPAKSEKCCSPGMRRWVTNMKKVGQAGSLRQAAHQLIFHVASLRVIWGPENWCQEACLCG